MKSVDNEQARAYMRDNVTPLFEQLLSELSTKRPADVAVFCEEWFKRYINDRQDASKQKVDSDSEEEGLKKRAASKRFARRNAITTEVYNSKESVDLKKSAFHKKSEETKTRILIRLKDSFLFSTLDDQQTNSLIDSMAEQTVEAGTIVLTQGTEADQLYVVDKGELEAYATVDGHESVHRHFFPGDCFGELALMYNHTANFSVRAKKTSSLYSLDRHTFANMSQKSARQRRQLLTATLPRVLICREMDSHEIDQLVDTAHEHCAYSNEYVVKEGELCDKIFVVARGRLAAYKKAPEGQQLPQQNVEYYTQGSYFGSEYFARGEPSPVSIVSLTNSRLFYVERDAIVRMLGSIDRILQRATAAYNRNANISIPTSHQSNNSF